MRTSAIRPSVGPSAACLPGTSGALPSVSLGLRFSSERTASASSCSRCRSRLTGGDHLRLAGEADGELPNRLRDLGVGLVEDDRPTLVQGGRHEPARRDHRVHVDLHDALHVGGVEAHLGVRPVQTTRNRPRQADREQGVERLRQVLHTDDVETRRGRSRRTGRSTPARNPSSRPRRPRRPSRTRCGARAGTCRSPRRPGLGAGSGGAPKPHRCSESWTPICLMGALGAFAQLHQVLDRGRGLPAEVREDVAHVDVEVHRPCPGP